MEHCQELVSANNMEVVKTSFGRSIIIIGIILGVTFVFAICDMGILALVIITENVPDGNLARSKLIK